MQLGALHSVLEERDRQDVKWGTQDHTPLEWLAILTEEVGELGAEVLASHFHRQFNKNLRAEAVQVAAVAIAIVECCDRNGWIK